jgi:hypothetical protein
VQLEEIERLEHLLMHYKRDGLEMSRSAIAEALLANAPALIAAAKAAAWRPIETAPRDGTRIIVAFWLHNKPDTERCAVIAEWVEGEGWMIDEETQWFPYPPTHWRPIGPLPGEG